MGRETTTITGGEDTQQLSPNPPGPTQSTPTSSVDSGNSQCCGLTYGGTVIGNYPFAIARGQRLVFVWGPDWKTNCCLWATVVIPSALVLAIPLKGAHWWMWMVTLILVPIACASLFVASFTNPGILTPLRSNTAVAPTTPVHPPEGSPKLLTDNQLGALTEDLNGGGNGGQPRASDADSDDSENWGGIAEPADKARWCVKCNIMQPPGAAHCRDCEVCVAGYDHHCPFMSQCVGKDNLMGFQCFIGCVMALPLWFMAVVFIKHG